MKRQFDKEGPTAEYVEPPMEEYYKTETNSRRKLKSKFSGWRERRALQKAANDPSPYAKPKPLKRKTNKIGR